MPKEIKEKIINLMFKNFGNCPKKLPDQILSLFEEELQKQKKEMLKLEKLADRYSRAIELMADGVPYEELPKNLK